MQTTYNSQLQQQAHNTKVATLNQAQHIGVSIIKASLLGAFTAYMCLSACTSTRAADSTEQLQEYTFGEQQVQEYDTSIQTRKASHGNKIIAPFKLGNGPEAYKATPYVSNSEIFVSGVRAGNLFMDNDGNLRGVYEDGSMAVDGWYAGYLWDTNGNLITTEDFLYSKYRSDFESDDLSLMYFDSEKELKGFIRYLQTYQSTSQGESINYSKFEDGTCVVSKRFFKINSISFMHN